MIPHMSVTRNDSTGRQMPRYSEFVGTYSAAFASNAWYPARLSNTQEALMRGTSAMLGRIISTEFHEFFGLQKTR